MIVGIISDIHGNDTALAGCLAAMKLQQVEKILFLGDLVGYYYNAQQTLEQLADWDLVAIRGNHDRYLIDSMDDPKLSSEIVTRYGSGIEHAKLNMKAEGIRWLEDLPLSRTITIDGVRIHMCHGSPHDPDLYVYPDTCLDTLHRCAAIKTNLVLMGHTHHAFAATVGETLIINPGSVGQPRDQRGNASFALFNTKNHSVRFLRYRFPSDGLVQQIRRLDTNCDQLIHALGRNT